MPAPHHSVFYRPDALTAAQPTASKHRRQYRHTGRQTDSVLVSRPLRVSMRPCVCLSVCPSICLSVCLPIPPCVCVCVCNGRCSRCRSWRTFCQSCLMSVSLSVCMFLCPSVCLSICLHLCACSGRCSRCRSWRAFCQSWRVKRRNILTDYTQDISVCESTSSTGRNNCYWRSDSLCLSVCHNV